MNRVFASNAINQFSLRD